ncbi:hypothetical protein ACOME3_004219 [Neoechinorhynchus agilis]
MDYEEEQNDERVAVECIFDHAQWKEVDKNTRMFKFVYRPPNAPTVDLQVQFPKAYPFKESLNIISLTAQPSLKDLSEIAQKLTMISRTHKGTPVLYELLSELKSEMDQLFAKDSLTDRSHVDLRPILGKPDSKVEIAPKAEDFNIFHGEQVVDRKSVFQAHAVCVHSADQAKKVLIVLKNDRKISTALHNIYAYRIVTETGSIIEDNEDDGETAAGSRLAHLLSVSLIQKTPTTDKCSDYECPQCFSRSQ